MSHNDPTPHPYAEQLARDPDWFIRRCAPHAYRAQQDRRFHRRHYTDADTRELAERLAVAERELQRLREREKQATPAPTQQVQQPQTPKAKPHRRYGDHRR
ncbi:MAG: hypothetical protein JXB13_11410 [Phycisphaerae bacterium]|nr:hypothetical protein [Phycisphaerae bacterium]